ncbi:ABC transporter ATP-binding protein YbbL [Escherichia coli]|uniref:ABC transporter ATP-binding protein YbbL n=1 Tax=Escherichia coli TaxID=562 RepID=A0A3S4L781_ECOLX|nr:ABC transporter ATP-binding protein YbbL [Escherichia coli]
MIHRYVREQNIAVLWGDTTIKTKLIMRIRLITLQPHAGEMQEARYELA